MVKRRDQLFTLWKKKISVFKTMIISLKGLMPGLRTILILPWSLLPPKNSPYLLGLIVFWFTDPASTEPREKLQKSNPSESVTENYSTEGIIAESEIGGKKKKSLTLQTKLKFQSQWILMWWCPNCGLSQIHGLKK